MRSSKTIYAYFFCLYCYWFAYVRQLYPEAFGCILAKADSERKPLQQNDVKTRFYCTCAPLLWVAIVLEIRDLKQTLKIWAYLKSSKLTLSYWNSCSYCNCLDGGGLRKYYIQREDSNEQSQSTRKNERKIHLGKLRYRYSVYVPTKSRLKSRLVSREIKFSNLNVKCE